MAQRKVPEEILRQAVETVAACGGNVTLAAAKLRIPRPTLQGRLRIARLNDELALLPPPPPPPPLPVVEQNLVDELKHRCNLLQTQLSGYQKEELSMRYVRSKIMGLSDEVPTPPAWLAGGAPSKTSPGVPTLLCSDWHWGEVIQPNQVGGVNEYNLEIAHQRARHLVTQTIDLLNSHMVNPKYPGIVFALGGDMVSGDIHDELRETNDLPLIPAVVDLFGVLIWCIETLTDKFGKVFVPCVTGNHGRNTQKIRAKDRAFTSFDWLVYVLLEKHFVKDTRVRFLVSEGPDAYYKVFNHRYLLTHLDQFRGGDGMIGALGPIIRGDHKKRSRNMQINMGYDTMIGGHWHQLIQLQRLIVNGSLCGYNEYAYQGNFPFEIPRQALWITHPQHGITFSMPVNVEKRQREKEDAPWLSVK